MIYCLTGKIIKKTLDSVVISCGGVGYFVQIPATTGEALPPAGQEGTVYTIMNVTENDVSLYGFAAEEQRDCFKMLTGVTGVGPKAALSILSIMTPEKIALAASSGDHKAFTKAAGVGPKLAQRITLELKDKVGKGLAAGTGFSGNVAAPAPSSAPAQAVAALVSLGYAPSDAAAAVARVDETLSVQEIITKATNAFIENDVAAAQTIEPLEQVIDNLKAELRARHTKRLQAGECTIETGMLFFDIINSFERIADHCSNLAVCIIELSQGSYQTHRYLKSVKSQENARFMESFEDYLRKYALH
jgi:Holliday junction DNA helicase RuvA